jgi:uncharacterized protein (TIGR00369 family)
VTTTGYPPAHHLLSDLGMEGEVVSPTEVRLRMAVTPHVLGPDGGVRLGVLATVVDVVGGSVALRAAGRERMATADLVVESVRPARGPWIEARAVLLRRGRTTLVVEARVVETGEGSTAAAPVAWASMTFALLPGRADAGGEEPASVDVAPEMPARWSFTGDGFDRPLLDSLGIEVLDPLEGRLSMPALPYHRNSFGAVQGGAMALLAEAAGAEAMRAACAARGAGAGPFAVTGLQIAYLALGRDGPIISRARVLDHGAGPFSSAFSSAVVELVDSGSEDRVTTLVNVSGVAVGDGDAGGVDVGVAAVSGVALGGVVG